MAPDVGGVAVEVAGDEFDVGWETKDVVHYGRRWLSYLSVIRPEYRREMVNRLDGQLPTGRVFFGVPHTWFIPKPCLRRIGIVVTAGYLGICELEPGSGLPDASLSEYIFWPSAMLSGRKLAPGGRLSPGLTEIVVELVGGGKPTIDVPVKVPEVLLDEQVHRNTERVRLAGTDAPPLVSHCKNVTVSGRKACVYCRADSVRGKEVVPSLVMSDLCYCEKLHPIELDTVEDPGMPGITPYATIKHVADPLRNEVASVPDVLLVLGPDISPTDDRSVVIEPGRLKSLPIHMGDSVGSEWCVFSPHMVSVVIPVGTVVLVQDSVVISPKKVAAVVSAVGLLKFKVQYKPPEVGVLWLRAHTRITKMAWLHKLWRVDPCDTPARFFTRSGVAVIALSLSYAGVKFDPRNDRRFGVSAGEEIDRSMNKFVGHSLGLFEGGDHEGFPKTQQLKITESCGTPVGRGSFFVSDRSFFLGNLYVLENVLIGSYARNTCVAFQVERNDNLVYQVTSFDEEYYDDGGLSASDEEFDPEF